MPSMSPVLLIGTGPMAVEYARVLRDGLAMPFWLSSRDPGKAAALAEETGAEGSVALGALGGADTRFSFAIVATAVESLVPVTRGVIEAGVRHVLVEKPGALSAADGHALTAHAAAHGALVRIAYNRRYYASVRGLAQVLQAEPALCATFDFTEWGFRIAPLVKGPGVKERWALGNSVHVVDTVCHLLGELREVRAIVRDAGRLDWHPSGATFVGSSFCGDTPVSWCTSWSAPGRWSIEVMTEQGRYKLSPMERLQVMRPGKVDWTEVPLDYALDDAFKPGLHAMVAAFAREAGGSAAASALPDAGANAQLLATMSTLVGYVS